MKNIIRIFVSFILAISIMLTVLPVSAARPTTQFLSELKMAQASTADEAKKMLTDTDLMVKEIAYACGFENEYYFSNFFKKHSALSPTAFRTLSS